MLKENPLVYLKTGGDFVPSLSVDCVLFGFHSDKLEVLLLKLIGSDTYMLPGGFVHKTENAEQAATRVLEQRTNVTDIFLEQFHTFTAVNRGDNDLHKYFLEKQNIPYSPDYWIFKRFISIGFFALVDYRKVNPMPDDLSESCDWYDISQLDKLNLGLDHRDIIEKAIETLRMRLDEKLLGFNLLPETFTMQDLQSLYETVLGEKLLRTNFQRKILSMNILERLEKKMTGGAHKAPYLYRFKTTKI